MFSAKFTVVLAFLLAAIVAINGISLCPETCEYEYNPLCVTMKDGSIREYDNICLFTIESCKRNIGIVGKKNTFIDSL